MKKAILLALALLVLTGVNKTLAQDCLPEGITFNSQEQIDSFSIKYPDCYRIMGEVKVQEASSGAITNLKGLSQITSIAGNLRVLQNFALANLNGLDNLATVGGSVSINMNGALSSLNGLENLSSIEGFFKIRKNASLTDLVGLGNLTNVNGYFMIQFNEALSSLRGLEKLDAVGASFLVNTNNSLANLSGLGNLKYVGECMSFIENDELINLTGLDNLTTVAGCVVIKNNSSLTNLNGLQKLTSIGGYLKVSDNASLSTLKGLENVKLIGGYMDVYNNPGLTSLNELDSLSVSGEKFEKEDIGIYQAWVVSSDASFRYTGYLKEVKNDGIVLSRQPDGDEWKIVGIEQIDGLKFRKKGKLGTSMFIGFLSGFVMGGVIGLSAGDDIPGVTCIDPDGGVLNPLFTILDPCFTAGQKGLLYGLPLAMTGGIIGAVAGSAKIKIPLNRDRKILKRKKADLLKYSSQN